MALQGDLSSFALPDVLRLLSSTQKTGALEVSNPPASGRLQFLRGQIIGGDVTTSEKATGPGDVVFEMLRFGGGSFVFDDIEDDSQEEDDSNAMAVAQVLSEAEALVGQWTEVESVVPSMTAVVIMVPELSGETVTLRADQWRAIASLGEGRSVRAIATHCGLDDLQASRLVKGLVEADLVSVYDDRSDAGAPEEAVEEASIEAPVSSWDDVAVESEVTDVVTDEIEGTDHIGPTSSEDLYVLHGEEGPVLLGEGDGRLLPEPLLDEVSAASTGTYEPMSYEHAAMDSSAPSITLGAVDGHSFESFEESRDQTHAAPDDQATTPDDDRGSLLRFLSTVEP